MVYGPCSELTVKSSGCEELAGTMCSLSLYVMGECSFAVCLR